jgi:hypothetical protein
MYCLFCDVLFIVCVYMWTVLLPPGGYQIAVKYIVLYDIISCTTGVEKSGGGRTIYKPYNYAVSFVWV